LELPQFGFEVLDVDMLLFGFNVLPALGALGLLEGKQG
jgi:hypothetical protein